MRKRKLRYVPGLISLLGLPVLLYFLGPQDPSIQTAIKIFMPTDDMKPNPVGELKFSKWYVYQTLKHKKIVAVDLRDPAQEIDDLDRFRAIKKLDFISNEIARRQFTHDTSSVFKIEFGRESTYGDFVWVLNLTRLYGVKRFVFIDNAYYLFTNPPPPPLEPIEDIKVYPMNDIFYSPAPAIKNQPTRWELFKVAVAEWWEKAILIIKRSQIYVLGFVLLIVIPAIIRLSNRRSILLRIRCQGYGSN